jgi:DNA-binding LacI/PurR family transcriptional regulator
VNISDPYGVLVARIQMGFYPPGSRLPAERELAAELSVHRHTIRSVVARLSADGLVECERYRRPVVRRTMGIADGWKTVALLMGNEAPFKPFHLVIRGCEPVLRADGYRLVFMDTWGHLDEATREREHAALQSLIDHPVAGAILWCQAPETSAELVTELQRRGMPIVAIDREIPGVALDYVGVDNAHAAAKAVKHLVDSGHRRIGFVAGAQDRVSTVVDRRRGYDETLAKHGFPHGPELFYGVRADRVQSATAHVARRLLAEPHRPTALFVVNDFYALYLMRAIRDVGLRVPEDVAVVGFDDIETLVAAEPVLTTVRQPFEEIGRKAASLLVERMRSPDAPYRHVELETAVLVRASTDTTNLPAPSEYAPVTIT